MAKLLKGKWIEESTIEASKLTTQAKADILAPLSERLIALRNRVLNKSFTGSNGVVTTEVLAASATDVAVTDLNTKGIYVGAVSGANDGKRVLIRLAGSDNGVDDGSGDDVFGVLTESTGVYTLSFKKANGDAFSFAGATAIDFFFVEVYDEASKPVDAYLNGVGGVIDASTADIALENKGRLDDVEDTIGTLDATPSNYTPVDAAVISSHLEAIDLALASAGGTSFSDATFEIVNGTKVAKFDASAITAGQTRTIAFADRNVNLANIHVEGEQIITLVAGDITNKYVDLSVSANVANVKLVVFGGLMQEKGVDYDVITDGTYVRRISWNGLGLDGSLAATDKLWIGYNING